MPSGVERRWAALRCDGLSERVASPSGARRVRGGGGGRPLGLGRASAWRRRARRAGGAVPTARRRRWWRRRRRRRPSLLRTLSGPPSLLVCNHSLPAVVRTPSLLVCNHSLPADARPARVARHVGRRRGPRVRRRAQALPGAARPRRRAGVWARVCARARVRACVRGCVRAWLRVCVCVPMMCACASVRVCVWGRACERMPPPAALQRGAAPRRVSRHERSKRRAPERSGVVALVAVWLEEGGASWAPGDDA